jgi:S-adenosylmethionine/arginine decarboxylase-like enzyme
MPLAHEHLIVRAEINNPPTNPEKINDWLAELVDGLGMKIMMGPFSAYSEMVGNRGLTGACIIETSHVVLHVWDEDNPGMLQLDVYSCAPVDCNLVLARIQEFEPTNVDFKFLDRADKFIRILGET